MAAPPSSPVAFARHERSLSSSQMSGTQMSGTLPRSSAPLRHKRSASVFPQLRNGDKHPNDIEKRAADSDLRRSVLISNQLRRGRPLNTPPRTPTGDQMTHHQSVSPQLPAVSAPNDSVPLRRTTSGLNGPFPGALFPSSTVQPLASASLFVFGDRTLTFDDPKFYFDHLKDAQNTTRGPVCMLGYRAFGLTYPLNASHIFTSELQKLGLRVDTVNRKVTLDVVLPQEFSAPTDVGFAWSCDYVPQHTINGWTPSDIGLLPHYSGLTTQGETRTITLKYLKDGRAHLEGDSQLVYACFSTPLPGWKEENWRNKVCADFSASIRKVTASTNLSSGLVVEFKGSWRVQRVPQEYL